MDEFVRYGLVWTILGIAGVTNGIIGFDRCFDLRHGNHRLYLIYFALKGIVTSFYASALVYMPPTQTVETIWMVFISVLAVTSFAVLWYTWEADPLKIGLYGVASDAVSGTSMIVAAVIINSVRGRGFNEEFLNLTIADAFAATIIAIILYSAVIKVSGRAIDAFGRHEIRNRRIMTAVVVLVVAGLSSSNLATRTNLQNGLTAAYAMFILLLTLAGMVIVRKLRSEMHRNKLLAGRNEMTEAYAMALDGQVVKIEKQEELLDYIKAKIGETAKTVNRKELSEHLEKLRAQAEELKRGLYSGNVAVDAVLSVFSERFKNKGYDVRYRLAGMQDAGEKAAEISMCILGWAEAACEEASAQAASSIGKKAFADNPEENSKEEYAAESKRIKYEIGRRGNQYIIELDMPAGKATRSLKKELRYHIAETDPLEVTVKRNRRTIRLMTEAPS